LLVECGRQRPTFEDQPILPVSLWGV
jgi:hypothetical protein